MQTVRLIAPSRTSGKNPFTAIAGRVYDVAEYSVLDVEAADAALMQANGWLGVAHSGTTAQRPAAGSRQSGVPQTAAHGGHYFDSTLGKLIVFDGRRNVWIDPVDGSVV